MYFDPLSGNDVHLAAGFLCQTERGTRLTYWRRWCVTFERQAALKKKKQARAAGQS